MDPTNSDPLLETAEDQAVRLADRVKRILDPDETVDALLMTPDEQVAYVTEHLKKLLDHKETAEDVRAANQQLLQGLAQDYEAQLAEAEAAGAEIGDPVTFTATYRLDRRLHVERLVNVEIQHTLGLPQPLHVQRGFYKVDPEKEPPCR